MQEMALFSPILCIFPKYNEKRLHFSQNANVNVQVHEASQKLRKLFFCNFPTLNDDCAAHCPPRKMYHFCFCSSIGTQFGSVVA